nr:hypothetical protein [Rhodoferax sp.]
MRIYMNPMRWCAIAVLLTVAASFVLLKAGFAIPGMGFAGLVLGFSYLLSTCYPPQHAKVGNLGSLGGLGLGIAVLFFALLWMFYKSDVLPTHDSTALPRFAQIIEHGQLLSDAYPKGRSGHAYPPGGPLLYRYAFGLLPPISALWFMKMTSLAAVALIPLAWGWMYHRLLPLPMHFVPWIALCYLAFWAGERTIGFALPFAGKNALIYGIALAPLVIVFMIETLKSRFGWLLAGLAVFGLTLINYSLLHLVAAVVGAYAAVALLRRSMGWRDLLRLFGCFAVPSLLMLALLGDVIRDPRAGNFHFAPVNGLLQLVEVYTRRLSPVVIYHDAQFGIAHYPYRGTLFLVALAICFSLLRRGGREQEMYAVGGISLGVFLVLMFAFGVIPLGITLDYARWIVWPIQAVAMAAVAAALLHRSSGWTIPSVVVACVAVGCAAWVFKEDARTYRREVAGQAITKRDLLALSNLYTKQAGLRPCRIVAESAISSDGLSAAQLQRKFDYSEIISACHFVNGSWVDAGEPDARAWDGLPPASRLERFAGDAIFLIGSREKIDTYVRRLEHAGAPLQWIQISDEAGITLRVSAPLGR